LDILACAQLLPVYRATMNDNDLRNEIAPRPLRGAMTLESDFSHSELTVTLKGTSGIAKGASFYLREAYLAALRPAT
jgi:hypothetical protein